VADDVRLVAAQTLASILAEEKTLAQLLPSAFSKIDSRDQPLLQELCFGACRWYPRLKQVYLQLIEKPLKAKDTDIEALILVGIYQLLYTRIPAHAAINETVAGANRIKKTWAVKLINALLRRCQREQESLLAAADASDQGRLAHPNWLIKAVRQHWPEQADAVFEANNSHPPMTLRVNMAKETRESYLQQLQIAAATTGFSSCGITLQEPCDPTSLPGFATGCVSVQDEAAQLAATLLAVEHGQRVLDACAAPGGKTGHILEIQPQIEQLVAMDISAKRLPRIAENLARIDPAWQSKVQLLEADAMAIDRWFDGRQFDRILLDAPCSATGVIRRHPDVKLLRLANQIDNLAQLQLALLNRLWSTLKPGGRLVYATCSIFPQENTQVVEQFLQQNADALEEKLDVNWGIAQPAGRQLLPQVRGHDGFYYAVIRKSANE